MESTFKSQRKMLWMFPFQFVGDCSYKIWVRNCRKVLSPASRVRALPPAPAGQAAETTASFSLPGQDLGDVPLRFCISIIFYSFLLISVSFAGIFTCTFWKRNCLEDSDCNSNP